METCGVFLCHEKATHEKLDNEVIFKLCEKHYKEVFENYTVGENKDEDV